jgi:peptidoglycan/xylan/chitin deacetylase (PgdA/CDA1 family)
MLQRNGSKSDGLLALLDRYEIPATWAIVGHLMLEGCSRHDGAVHADVMPRPDYSWFPKDWYVHDPCTSAIQSPGWYAPDILEWIRATRVRHEIASHSFAHIYYGDPECSASAAGPISQPRWRLPAARCHAEEFRVPTQSGRTSRCAARAGYPRLSRGGPHPVSSEQREFLYKTLSFLDQLLGLPPRLCVPKR